MPTRVSRKGNSKRLASRHSGSRRRRLSSAPADRYGVNQSSPAMLLQRSHSGKGGLTPADVVQLQGVVGNQAVGRLLNTGAKPVIQRKLDQKQLDRLKKHLGGPKLDMVLNTKLEDKFDALSDDILENYKSWRRDDFGKLLTSLQDGVLAKVGNKVDALTKIADKPGQIMEIVGSVLETGDDAAEIAGLMGMTQAAMMGWKAYDKAAEGGGGSIAGAKDTYEGAQGLGQGKYVEGGLTTLSGLSGLAGLIPGVPDAAGIASAGMKTAAGITKLFNAEINRRALNRLKVDGSKAGSDFLVAIDALLERNSFLDGIKQTALGGLETAGSFMGTTAKWGVTLGVKAVEPVYNLSAYLGRGLASTFGMMESNAKIQEDAEKKKNEQASKIRAVVLGKVDVDLIGRLRRLAELIEPDFASEIDNAAQSIPEKIRRDQILAAIKKHNTWQPE